MKPKDTFYIGELSKLFNISVDSIRYYEKVNLIHPIRDPENGYRYYTLDDFQTLVLIRELLELGFHSEQIREFISNRTVDSTLNLLEKEINMVNESILELYEKKNSIQNRLNAVRTTLSITDYEKVLLSEKPKRSAVMITDENLPDNYVDYHMVKFMKQSNQHINTIGFCDCYTLDLEHSNPNSDYYRTKNVFFLGAPITAEYNYYLPAGNYLCIFYKGSLKKTKLLMPKLFQYAKKHRLQITGDPIELCHIDSYETSRQDEYVIEIELPVQ